MGSELPIWSILPFAGILLSIALFPLLAPEFWHRHFPKVSAAWALLFAIPFLIAYRGEAVDRILETFLLDYLPFIILLWGLYTIAGGIYVKGDLQGRPLVNVALIAAGTLLASWVGTTGAAMIMIRPLMRANALRKHKAHVVVFFIFLVANIGGCLTPLGDPPLFLGFLHGVSFFWTLSLWPEMITLATILLVLFYIMDTIICRREDMSLLSGGTGIKLRVEGLHNLIFLAGIVGGVLFSGLVHMKEVSVLGVEIGGQDLIRDGWIVVMGLLSLRLTSRIIRWENQFTWGPIKEVAYLFAGIFMTMIPALAILLAGEQGALRGLITALRTPDHFFWASGTLSSFLDNAPTYLTFFNTALGKLGLNEGLVRAAFADGTIRTVFPEFLRFLTSISLGAVFMGANTYIGNAPNFMVKSIAEEYGVDMPSFFGYMFKYSIPILIPSFFLLMLIF